MLEWIITSSVLIMFVTVIRYLFRKRLSLRVRYALWLAVAIRLLIPVTFFDSPVSVLNLLPIGENAGIDEGAGTTYSPVKDMDDVENTEPTYDAMNWSNENEGPDHVGADNPQIGLNGQEDSEGIPEVWRGNTGEPEPVGSKVTASTSGKEESLLFKTSALLRIWLCGVIAGAVLIIAVNLSYARRLQRSRTDFSQNPVEKLPVYVSKIVRTPCLFGIFHPAIYLTPEATEAQENLHYVLRHEKVHYKHRDNLWSLIRTVCLCLHWYNPFVWLAASLSRQDGELACDEETIRQLGEDQRKDYGMALLEFCAKGHVPFGSVTLATTMSGGKRKLRERLELIAKQPKKTVGALAAVVLLIALLVTITFTGRQMQQEMGGMQAQAAGTQGEENKGLESDSEPGAEGGAGGNGVYGDSKEAGEVEEWVFGYSDYTGYLDECLQWSKIYRDRFVDQDYDGDGLIDRVWRDNIEDWAVANYRIEFGNGDVLQINDMGGGEPKIRSVDLAGNGTPEILVTLEYGYSTDPTVFGSMALFEKTREGYVQIELPGGMIKEPRDSEDANGGLWKYIPTLTYHIEKAGNSRVRISCLESADEAPLDVTVDLSLEVWDGIGPDFAIYGEINDERPIWKVEIGEGRDGLPRLLLYTGMINRGCPDSVILTLNGQDGKLHMERMDYYHYYDEHVPIDLGDGNTYELSLMGSTLLGSGKYRTESVSLVWLHDNVGEWVEEIDFTEARRESGGSQLEAISPDGGILVTDLNFDGIQDFCIQAWTANGNTPYYCFVRDVELQQFVYVGIIANVETDEANRCIVSSTYDGGQQYSTSYYYLDGENQLVLKRWGMINYSPSAELDELDLTYVNTSFSLPAIVNWEYEIYGGELLGNMLYCAEQALIELYRWSGAKVETAYFTVTDHGTVYFAQTAEELPKEDYFYSRCYGASVGPVGLTGFSNGIQHMIFDPTCSPVSIERFPDNLEQLGDEEIAAWYFEQWAEAAGNGEAIDSIEENMKDNTALRNFVIKTKSGVYYEMTYYSEDLTQVNYIFGPYPDYPRH